jgi:alpha-D-ribose 1-methylphosphonate 5-triphosphate synthase subunit PhnH
VSGRWLDALPAPLQRQIARSMFLSLYDRYSGLSIWMKKWSNSANLSRILKFHSNFNLAS